LGNTRLGASACTEAIWWFLIFGINQHGPSGADEAPDNVGKFSAGCLVGKSMAGHRAFMAIVKADPRFVADPEYLFRTAILAERDVVPAA
jgi:hypothetical protein